MTTQPSPLIQDFEALHAQSSYIHMQVGEPAGDGWFTPADFQSDTSSALDNLLEQTRMKSGCDDKRLRAVSVASSYAWHVSAGGVSCFLATGRVPDMSADNILLHFDDGGWHDQLALRSGRFYTLPDDPAADHPCAIVVENRDALITIFRTQVEAHMRAIIDRLHVKMGMGKPGMWGVIADRIASMIIHNYSKTGREHLVEDEIKAFLHVSGSPLKGKSGVITLTYNDRSQMFLKRGGCCQYYKVAEYGYCSTCPLQTDEVREGRLLAYMAEQAS